MAITADEVQVRLEAATDKYVADLIKADKTFATLTKNMEKNAIAAGASFSNIGTGAVTAAARTNAAFASIDDTSGRLQSNVSNIAAQFQDIGVTAASGMNPVIIALQQGTQLSAVFNDSLGKGISPVKALGAAFGQILNPISLATIALVALGAAAIQYFTTLLDNGPASEEELKKQDDVLRDIADKWGDLVPAVKAYIEARDKASEEKQTAQGFQDLIKRGWDDARVAAQKAGAEFSFAMATLQNAGQGTDDTVTQLSQAYAELTQSVQAGNATTEQADRVTQLLAAVIAQSGIPTMNQYANVFQALSAAIAQANAQQQAFTKDQQAVTDPNLQTDRAAAYVAEQERINSLTSDQLQLENEVARVKKEAERDNTVLTDGQALQIAQDRLAAEERRRDVAKEIKADTKDDNKAEADRQAVLDYISTLEFELSLIGKSNEQRAVEIALRQAGAAATQTQKDHITDLVQEQMRENDELARAKELYDTIKGASEDALKGFLHDIAEGKSAGEAFGNVLDNILSKLIDFGVSTALNAIFPGLGTLVSGARASGGPVSGNSPYLVGEKGPEIFTPSSSGKITSNSDMAKMGSGNGGKVALTLTDGLRAAFLDDAARQTVQIINSQVPMMIQSGAPQAAAQASRNRTV